MVFNALCALFGVIALVDTTVMNSSALTPPLPSKPFVTPPIPFQPYPLPNGLSYNGDQNVLCPKGFTLTKMHDVSETNEFCTKLIPARSWNEAMDTCCGNNYFAVENFPPEYNISWWLQGIAATLENNPSFSEYLLWLPAKHRAPGGPLYPHSLSKSSREANSSKTWGKDSTEDGILSISQDILDTGSLCLAWYVHSRTPTTRPCSENLSTLCVAIPRNVNQTYSEMTHPVELGLSECTGMDYVVPNHLGVNSCYKAIVATNATSGFSWQEAELQCKEIHPQARLAILTPQSAAILHLVQKKSRKTDRLWISIDHPKDILLSSSGKSGPGPGSRDAVSASTSLEPGYIASTSENNGLVFFLEVREIKLRDALCQVNFEFHPYFDQITHYLMITWKNSTVNSFVLRMGTQEIATVTNHRISQMKMRSWKIIRDRLQCFADGRLITIKEIESQDSKYELSGEFSTNFTSFFCESFTLGGTFLRSNTLLWPNAEMTFVVLVSVFNTETENQDKNQRESNVSETDKLEKASAQNLTTNPHVINFRQWFTWRNCRLSDAKYDRVLDSSDEQNSTLARHYILCSTTARNLKMAYNQVHEAVNVFSKEANTNSQVYQVKAIRGMTRCMEEVVKLRFVNLSFPETPIGETTFSREHCAQKYGSLLQRTCMGDIYRGAYWGRIHSWTMEEIIEDFPFSLNCSDLSKTTFRLLDLFEVSHDLKYALSKLRKVTETWTELTIADIQLTALLLESISRMNSQLETKDLTLFAEIIEGILRVNPEILARAQQISNVTSALLNGLVNIVLLITKEASQDVRSFSANLSFLATKLNENSSEIFLTSNASNLSYTINSVENVRFPNTAFNFDSLAHDAALKLKISSRPSFNGTTSYAAIIYHRTVQLANAATTVGRDTSIYVPNPSNGDKDTLLPNYIAHGPIVQVALSGGTTLFKSLQIFFRPLVLEHVSYIFNKSVCVSWNSRINGWSTRGCQLLDPSDGYEVCECDHLSSFTIAYSYKDVPMTTGSDYDMLVLIGTTIGCGLSLFGLLGVLTTYAIFPKWREPQPKYHGHHIIFHCSLALTALVLTFMIGIELTGSPTICLIIALLLHYFTLAVFFWMLVRAYYNYLLFVKVWAVKTSRFMLKASLFAWGLPLLIPCATILINSHFYQYTNHTKYCWLSPQGFNYFLLPFVAVIGMLNMVLHIIISVKLCCVRKELRSTQNGKQTLTNYAALAVAFLVGFILTFALVATVEDRTFFSYLFVLFTSLQGLVIFFSYVYRGKTAREQWRNFVRGKSNRQQAQEKLTANIFRGKPNLQSIRSLIKSGSTQCSSQRPETP